MNKVKKTLIGLVGAVCVSAAMGKHSNKKELNDNIDANNPYLYENNKPRLEEEKKSFYQKMGKRAIDASLAFCGLIVLSPLFAVISAAIVIDDPGPILFEQKRVGKDKHFFKLHKFRSMKMSTPHDVPTHELPNPEQYITTVGKFLRKTSLDELPQIWDILRGKMSIIGPRPALWNQEDLVEERDKYGANNVTPGLTGWAQINGRDELEIEVKAEFDGEYVKHMNEGGIKAFLFDCKCFAGTILSVVKREGVVEGGTGSIHNSLRHGVPLEDPDTPFGCDLSLVPDRSAVKRVLITGAGSYIGESVEEYAKTHYKNIRIDTISLFGEAWKETDFSKYDCVYHVAGIAHSDIGKAREEEREKYYSVNTDLAISVAEKAKEEGVGQFIFMSSMIVYGDSTPYGVEKIIDRNTKPNPSNFYGDSKWQADKGVRALADKTFKVAVLRPPMVYGRGSKGNYQTLSKMAKKLPIFPDVENKRSMLFIDNLCEFICCLIMCGEGGLYFPQNSEYTRTSDMVRQINDVTSNAVVMTKAFKPIIGVFSRLPGRIGTLTNKAFGNFAYSSDISKYSFDYVVVPNNNSIALTEKEPFADDSKKNICIVNCFDTYEQRVDLIKDFFLKQGYNVEVVTSDFRHFEKTRRRDEKELFTYVATLPYKKNISIARIRSHLKLGKDIFRMLDDRQYDLLWLLIPPNNYIKYAACYKDRHPKIKLVVDVIDLWPETMPLNSFKRTWIFTLWRKLRDDYLNRADMVITECDLYQKYLPDCVRDNMHSLYLSREATMPYGDACHLDNREVVLGYVGSINNIVDIEAIVGLIKMIKKHKNVALNIIGDGENKDELIQACQDAGARVSDYGVVYDAEKKYSILSECHYGLNIMKDSVLVGLTMKSIDYFEAGLPIINNIKGDTDRLVQEYKIGYNMNGMTAREDMLLNYDLSMRKRTREVFEVFFAKESFEKKLFEIIEEIMQE